MARWNFPGNQDGQVKGVADAGIENFNGTKTYKYDMVNGMLPKTVEVFTGCKVGDVIEMMGKEWRIEDVIF